VRELSGRKKFFFSQSLMVSPQPGPGA